MEYFFEEYFCGRGGGDGDGNGDVVWFKDDFLPMYQGGFVPYTNGTRIEVGAESIGNGSNSRNAHKRMIEFLRKIQSAKNGSRPTDRERGHLHMINERMRREREKRNYFALHSILPIGTKSDKNSVVQVAAKRIQELECYKEALESRNQELEAKMGMNINGGTKIGLRVVNPISGIDYMLEALKWLKKTGSRIINIQAEFSELKLTAVIHAENDQMGDAELKNGVEVALKEVDQKLRISLPELARSEMPNRKRLRLQSETCQF